MGRVQKQSKRLVKTPSLAFSKCPACDSPNIMKFEGEVICTYCGWDSIALRVEARFATRDVESLGGFEELRTIETMSEREDAAAVSANKLIYGSTFNNNEPSVA